MGIDTYDTKAKTDPMCVELKDAKIPMFLRRNEWNGFVAGSGGLFGRFIKWGIWESRSRLQAVSQTGWRG